MFFYHPFIVGRACPRAGKRIISFFGSVPVHIAIHGVIPAAYARYFFFRYFSEERGKRLGRTVFAVREKMQAYVGEALRFG